MSGASQSIKISDKSQLVDWLKKQETDAENWRIGTEHEKFLFRKGSFRPVSYEGEAGIGVLLSRLADKHSMTPISEKGHIIGLKDGQGGSITLEPGGQFELSGAPLENLHQTCSETGRHLNYMREITAELNLCMLGSWISAALEAGGYLLDAKGPLQDYAGIYAETRESGTGYDVAILHGSGQFGLCE